MIFITLLAFSIILYLVQSASAQSIPATLVPREYHIVKHPGVMGLEFHDE